MGRVYRHRAMRRSLRTGVLCYREQRRRPGPLDRVQRGWLEPGSHRRAAARSRDLGCRDDAEQSAAAGRVAVATAPNRANRCDDLELHCDLRCFVVRARRFGNSRRRVMLSGALTVTYALLKRRVLDFEFVLGRTLVVATVSLIVVDAVLFRKRHEDERALKDFATEAQYVTEPVALLDRTIKMVRLHTDARSAAILTNVNGSYVVERSFGDGITHAVPENDPTILALKAWHKPIDPHRYDTGLRGALALPMISRSRLTGILLLGERAGGEAYAPDEVEALSQFARGVGSSLDALTGGDAESIGALRETLASAVATLDATMRALPDAIASRLQSGVTRPA